MKPWPCCETVGPTCCASGSSTAGADRACPPLPIWSTCSTSGGCSWPTWTGSGATRRHGGSSLPCCQRWHELSENTAARQRSSRRHLATQHRWGGGSPTFGYRVVEHPSGTGRALEPDPVEAELVREAFQGVADGRSLRSIVKSWNERGIRTRRGREWIVSTLSKLLRSEAVLGRAMTGGRAVLDADGYPAVAWEPSCRWSSGRRRRPCSNLARRDHGRGSGRMPCCRKGCCAARAVEGH